MQDSLASLLTNITVKFQANTAVAVHITKVWDVATLNFTELYRHFGRTCCSHSHVTVPLYGVTSNTTVIFTERDAVPITVMNRHFSVITYMQKSCTIHPTSWNEEQGFHAGGQIRRSVQLRLMLISRQGMAIFLPQNNHIIPKDSPEGRNCVCVCVYTHLGGQSRRCSNLFERPCIYICVCVCVRACARARLLATYCFTSAANLHKQYEHFSLCV